MKNDNNIIPQSGDFDALRNDYKRLLRSFRFISSIEDDLERRFLLNRVAPWHDIPKSECRAMFDSFLAKSAINGGDV